MRPGSWFCKGGICKTGQFGDDIFFKVRLCSWCVFFPVDLLGPSGGASMYPLSKSVFFLQCLAPPALWLF